MRSKLLKRYNISNVSFFFLKFLYLKLFRQFIIKFYLGENRNINKLKEFGLLNILYKKEYLVPKPLFVSKNDSYHFLIMEFISDLSLDRLFGEINFSKAFMSWMYCFIFKNLPFFSYNFISYFFSVSGVKLVLISQELQST